ncbi:uncharacterized protein BCR38DRAFT_477616 [Pseudomassariella vexata]|uniref:Cytochrome P450 n=1 Tax=Pseudomassariella vexata TaxID=1141098 RepID=A0A1Y2DHQ6_9PEZI|nr:uncharacterized protein BCR38DRAFT_477616 [Pseudomassariella vexata]ORY58777.1 hypothetical protein BCR38DRAFT_477616 [Pseudomassariella vexata]
MHDLLRPAIQSRIDLGVLQTQPTDPTTTINNCTTVVDLFLKDSKKPKNPEKLTQQADQVSILDETMLSDVQILIFTGHGTTATALCFIFHEFFKHPFALE